MQMDFKTWTGASSQAEMAMANPKDQKRQVEVVVSRQMSCKQGLFELQNEINSCERFNFERLCRGSCQIGCRLSFKDVDLVLYFRP